VRYAIVIVGGGLGGSTLAKSLAECGVSALVLERETAFKDRVRGEQMHPWGVAEARALGVYDDLLRTCGHQTRWWVTYAAGVVFGKRDLQETSPHRVGSFNLYHPEMQETLLRLAEEAGAQVRRGIKVSSVTPGSHPSVEFDEKGSLKSVQARLVVCADGRNSAARSWAGFTVNRDPEHLMVSGTLLEATEAPDDSTYVIVGLEGAVLMAPQGKKRARTYFMYRKVDGLRRLSGHEGEPEFLSCVRNTGVPPEWLENAQIAGPLAQFVGADHWVDHPARDGIVLIGDAAAASDPSWGCGLSQTLTDVRHLRDHLLSESDWTKAAEQYALDHDAYYGALRGLEKWWEELMWASGPTADERRARILPTFLVDPAGLPDLLGFGPASPPADEQAWRFLRSGS
jgi:menaquinone-9 beta-reductase